MRFIFTCHLKICLLAVLVFLITFACLGETLFSFKDGSDARTDDLLAQKKALIYIERECPVCHHYLQELGACKESVKEKFQIVSVNTPAQTKQMAHKIPSGLPLYLVKYQKGAKAVYSTPTTKFEQVVKVGILKCEDLEKLISVNQK